MKMLEKNGTMKMWLPFGGTFPLSLDSRLRWFLVVALGGLFFWVGLQKLIHSMDFLKAVLAYRLLPVYLVGVTAAVLPWMELTAGLLLMVGVKRRSCLLLLGLLIAGFIVIMMITMARGMKIDCGCGIYQSREVGLGPIMEDGVLLALIGGLYWWESLVAVRKQPPFVAGV